MEAQCTARRTLDWVWEARAPSPGLQPQLLLLGSMTSYSQGRWNFKGGSQTTNNVVTKGSQTPRCRSSQYQKNVDWDQTRTEHQHSLLSVCGSGMRPIHRRWSGCWTSSEKNSRKVPCTLHGEALGKSQCIVQKGLKEAGGDESKIHVVYGKIQISFFVGGDMAAKYTPEGHGLAGEGLEF